ncbi:MAG: alpha-L-fucosidase [Planctomycetes bacterium]|nr:alpha-L-fucosidase [Planctomycetota bacterium]
MPTTRPTPGDTAWFVHDRFGLFIHWGLYAMPARHEWVQHNEKIPNETYDQKFFTRFDPDLYDPAAWADAAAAAGMKYVVVTVKHHEGFCLWDSAHTDFKATNSPAKCDLLRPLVDAFRARGLRIGLYYSLIDWHHPHFIVDPYIGPCRDHPDRAVLNRGRDQRIYAKYMRDQVTELLTQYGDIDILWFDFSYPKEDGSGKGRAQWESDELYALVRRLRPGIILDDRLDMGDEGWDIKTPEQFQPRGWVHHKGTPVVWEACQTFGGSWGYHRDEASWKSPEQLVHMLIDTVAKGGNLLLNVGPTARGEFDPRAVDRFGALGRWMHHHARAIRGCTQAPDEFVAPTDCRLTWNPVTRRVYVHVFAWPFQILWLDGLGGKVAYAQLLHDGSEIEMKGLEDWQHAFGGDTGAPQKTLSLRLPVRKPDVLVPVIELFLA